MTQCDLRDLKSYQILIKPTTDDEYHQAAAFSAAEWVHELRHQKVSLVPLPSSPLITDTSISVENPVVEVCGNPWEPDSRGLYVLGYRYNARNVGLACGFCRLIPRYA